MMKGWRSLLTGATLAVGAMTAACSSSAGKVVPEKPNLPQYCILVLREGRFEPKEGEGPLPPCGFTVTTKYAPIVYRRAANVVFSRNIWGSHRTGERDRFITLHIYGEEAYQELVFYMSRVYHFLETPTDPRIEQVKFFDGALHAWYQGVFAGEQHDPAKIQESLAQFRRLIEYEGVAPHFKRWALLWEAWLLVEYGENPEEGVRRYEVLAQSAETRLSAPALSHLARYYNRRGDRAKSDYYDREIVARFARDPRWAQTRYFAQHALAEKSGPPPGVRTGQAFPAEQAVGNDE